ncbi:polycystin-1-like isoform X2 [Ptychodera flava]|uniref:polycystin-1-like isoform X2 n=1 Tax=Ptychodera flava TaxID=63121 RepID=UPI00396A786F
MYPNVWEHCKYGAQKYSVFKWCVMLLLAVLAGFAKSQDCVPCPQDCQCSSQSASGSSSAPVSCVVDCQQLSLSSLPPINASLGTSVVHLIFSSNNISSFSADYFQAFSNLEYLTLESNELPSLPAGCLDSLTKLQILDLSNNLITTLDVNIFQDLTSLEELYLQGNLLSHLADGLFAGPTSINKLNLNGNQISFLEDDIFTGLDDLESLDLSGNQFTSLSENVFTSLLQLSTIALGNNPYLCDCNLRGLKRWINGFSGTVDSADITCNEPYYYSGQPVTQMPDEDLGCISGHVSCEKSGNSSVIVFYDYKNESVNFTQNLCNENCFYLGYPYAAVTEKLQCLCGHIQVNHSSPTCGSSCSDPSLTVDCQRYVLRDTFASNAGITFTNIRTSYNYVDDVSLSVNTAAPVDKYVWDFGDETPLLTTLINLTEHKYILPGVYTVLVTVYLHDISDSLNQEISVDSTIIISTTGGGLICPQVADTRSKVDVVVRLYQGTNVFMNWFYPSPFPEDVGDVEMLKTGVCPFDHHPYEKLHESAGVPTTPNQTVVAISPGMFFECAGSLVGWDFISTDNSNSEELRLQVYTPVCPTGQILISPGCLELCSPFAVCVDLENNPNCSAYDVELCQTETSGFQYGDQPSYELKSQVVTQVNATKRMHFHISLSVPVEVKENDVIGMQYVNKPVYCPDKPPDEENRYGILTGTATTWLSVGDVATNLNNGVDHSECFLQAIYSTPLEYHSDYDEFKPSSLSPGTKMYVAQIGNGLFSTDVYCEIVFQDRIKGVSIIHPPYHPEGLSPNSVGTHYITADTSVLLVLAITAGTDATSEWTFHGPSSSETVSPLDLAGSCPAPVNSTVPECDSDNMPSTTSYAYYNKTYNETGDYVVQVLVHNRVNSRTIYLDVAVQDYIEGLTVTHFSSLALVGYEQVFTANTTKGTSITYSWSADTWLTVITMDQNPELRHTFSTPGDYTLLVNASNGLNTEVASLDVSIQGMAPLANLTFISAATLVSSRTEVLFQIQFQGDQYYNVTVSWNFDDEASVFEETVTPSIDPTVAAAPHTFNSAGNFTVNVTVYNVYDSISSHVTVEVFDAITGVDINASDVVATNQEVSFVGVISGGNSSVLYNWTVAEAGTSTSHVIEQTQPALLYTFTQTGTYQVTLEVTTPVSSMQASKTVRAEEIITGLSVTFSPGPYQAGAVVTVTAAVETGSDIDYSFYTGTGDMFMMPHREFFYVYDQLGNFTFLVRADNTISHAELEFEVSVIETFSLNGIAVPECSATGVAVNMSAIVSSKNFSMLTYTWDFGDNMTLNGAYQDVSHVYTSDGPYKVTVAVQDGESHTQRLSTDVCVEGILTEVDVSLLHDSVVATIRPTKLAIEVNNRIIHEVMWIINDEILGLPSSSDLVHSFDEVGQHTVTAHVFNKVSSVNVTSVIITQQIVDGLALRVQGLDPVSFDDSIDELYVLSGREYTFNASVLTGTSVTYNWSFGISNATGESVLYTYPAIGKYEIQLVASNQVSSQTRRFSVLVLEPVSGLSISKEGQDVAVAGSLVTFTATVMQGNSVTYAWQICPACGSVITTGALDEFTHNFTESGLYTVHVTASNQLSHDTDSMNLTVLGEIVGLTIYSDLKEGVYAVKGSSFPYNFTANVTSGVVSNNTWSVEKHGQQLYSTNDRGLSYVFDEIGPHKVEVTVANVISEETEWIVAEAIEEISGHSMSSNKTGIIAVGEPVLFMVTYDYGSNVTFHWIVEYGQEVITEEPYLVYAFQTPGNHFFQVSLVNPVSAENVYTLAEVMERVTGAAIVLSTDTGYYVPVDVDVNYTAVIATGSDESYLWTFPSTTYNTQRVRHRFSSLGVKEVSVVVSNSLGDDEAVVNITVQQPIVGLTLETTEDIIATETEVVFVAKYTEGSDITFIWSVSGDPAFPITTTNDTLTYTFASVGFYTVNVTAENGLGSEMDSLGVTVQEQISGLYIEDCCDMAYAVREEITFTAGVATGTNVQYRWVIDGDKIAGQQVHYQFSTIGSYTISLLASNQFSFDNITEVVTVQERIENLQIETSSVETMYTDHNVTFTLLIDSGSDVLYTIDYDDKNSEPEQSTHNVFTHAYRLPRDYHVKAYANNSLGMTAASTNITIKLLLCQAPTLTLIGSYTRQTQRSDDIYVEYDINLYRCVKYNTVYLWKVFKTADCNERHKLTPIDLPRSVNTAVPLLHLRGHTLEYGEYCLEFSAQFEETPLISVDSLRLTVLASPLVAVISGGRIRTTSVQDTLVLDASESYDPDLPNDEQTTLEVEWTCTKSIDQISTTSGNADGCFPDVRTEVILQIEADTLVPGYEYVFELVVSKQNRMSGTSKQRVIVKEYSQPSVTISCRTCRFQPTVRISPSERISMRGRCGNCFRTQVSYIWNVTRDDGEILPLNMVTTTTGGNSPNLVIRKGAVASGHGYTFLLTVQDISGTKFSQPGYAEMQLPYNNPPTGGACSIEPKNLIALEDMLSFNCKNWTDDDNVDEPLRYSVLLHRAVQSNAESEAYMLYWGTQNEYSVLTPVGLEIYEYEISVMVLVEDKYGTKTVGFEGAVTINFPESMNTSMSQWLYEKSIQELQFFRQTNDPQKVIAYSTALITVLNAESIKANKTDFDYRVATRTNIVKAVTEVKISSVMLVRQISSALIQSTSVYVEFIPTQTFNAVNSTINNIVFVTEESLSNGDDPEEIPANSIMTVISNVIDALNHFLAEPFEDQLEEHEREAMILTLLRQANLLLTHLAKSKVLHESAVEVLSPGIRGLGQRSNRATANLVLELDGCKVDLPADFFNNTAPEHEILEVMMCHLMNPYTWGTSEGYNITSQVHMLEYSFDNGTSLLIQNLENDIKMNLQKVTRSYRASQFLLADSYTSNSTYTCSPTDDVMYVTSSVTPLQTAIFSIGELPDPKMPTAMHIQVRYERQTDHTEPKVTSSVTVYIGHNKEPDETSHYSAKTITEDDLLADHQNYTFFISASEYDPNHEWFVAVTNNFKFNILNVSVGVYYSSCQYYNETLHVWMNTGCVPSQDSMASCVVCDCNHLTAFGGSSMSTTESVQFVGLRSNADSSIMALITVGVLIAIYLIAALVAYWRDRIDLCRVGVMPLCGKDGSFKYEITIKTGMKRGAGTSAHVGINIFGEQGRSGRRHLSKSGAFVRNSLDTFVIAADIHLGDIWKVRVWHDNTGLSPCWYLSRIIVHDLHSDKKYYFLCGQWLTLTRKDGVVKKDFMAADAAQLSKFSTLFPAELGRGFSERHLWFSMYERPLRSRFTRFQRVTCCFTLALLFLGLNTLWYGLLRPQTQVLWITWAEALVGLVTASIGFIVIHILVLIFQNRKYKVSVSHYNNKPMTAQTVEMDALIEMSQTGDSMVGFGGHNVLLPGTTGIKHCDSFRHLPHGETSAALADFDDDEDDDDGEDDDIISSFQNNNIKKNGLGWPIPPKCKSPKLPELRPLEKGKWWSYESILSWPEELPPYEGSWRNKKSRARVLSDQSDMRKRDERPDSGNGHNSSSYDDDLVDDLINDLDDLPTKHHWHKQQTKTVNATITKDTFTPRAEPDLTQTRRHQDKVGSAGSRRSHHRDDDTMSTDGHYTTVSTTMSTIESSKPTTLSTGKDNQGREREQSRTHLRSNTGSRKKQSKNCYLPSWFAYINYLLCFILCVGSLVVVVYYGGRFNSNQAAQWIVAVSLAFVFSIFILEPLQVICIAVFRALLRKPLDDYGDDDIVEDQMIQNLEGPNHSIRPPGGYALIQAKEEARKISVMYTLLWQFVVWLVFIWLVLMVNYYSGSKVNQYAVTWRINDSFTGTKYGVDFEESFYTIRTLEDFWSWSNGVMATVLHSAELDPFEEEASYAYSLPIGIARLRQIRTVPVDCDIRKTKYRDADIHDTCKSSGDFDTRSFNAGWVYNSSINQTWLYSTEEQLDGRKTTGQVHSYSGGGYVQHLGSSYQETIDILQNLQENKWIDRWTTVVFMEHTVYNVNRHLYSLIHLLVEFPQSSGAFPLSHIMTVNLTYYNGYVTAMTIFMGFFGLFMLFFLVREILNMRELGWSYLSSVWHWLDMILIILGIAMLSVYIYQQLYTAEVMQRYFADPNGFTNFHRVMYYIDLVTVLCAIILFLVCLKLLRILRFSRLMSTYLKTLSFSAKYIFCLMVIFLIVLWAYSHQSYMIYGPLIKGLHSMGSSLVALLGLIRGPSIDLDECIQYYPVLTPLIFTFFWIVVWIIFHSMFAAIIINSYRDVKEQSKKPTLDSQDYEMIDFMLKRFKKMLGISKVKQWRPKVKFRGLESLSSQSSRSTCSTRQSSRVSSASSSSGFQSLYMEQWAPEQITDLLHSLSPAVDVILEKFEEVQEIGDEEELLVKKWADLEKEKKERKAKETQQAAKKSVTVTKPGVRTNRQRRISVPDRPGSGSEGKTVLAGRPKSEQCERGKENVKKKPEIRVAPAAKKAW